MNIAKYCASGNDFLIFHSFVQKDRSELAKKLCDRNYGIGADGLIVLLPSLRYDFKWEFYNSDGSRANMCANGARAAVLYAYEYGLTLKREMNFLSGAGKIEAQVLNKNRVKILLGQYRILRDDIEEFSKEWWLIDTGVKHLVSFVDDISYFNKDEAKILRQKYNSNVNIAKIEKGKIFVRTYEKGVEGETLACGTGMAASFVAAYLQNKISHSSTAVPKSRKELKLEIFKNALFLEGEAFFVFEVFVKEAI